SQASVRLSALRHPFMGLSEAKKQNPGAKTRRGNEMGCLKCESGVARDAPQHEGTAAIWTRIRAGLYRAARAQHVERDAMALVRRGNPAIERDEQQHVANLVRRAAVGERAVEVDAKLARVADRRRHRDRRERFCLERQRRAAPDVAIGIGVDHVLQRLPERAESFGSLLHRLLAEYLAA